MPEDVQATTERPMQELSNNQPRQHIAGQDRARPRKVTGKLQVALDAMVFEGLPYDEAAQKANITVRAIRMALSKQHVIAYIRQQRDVLRTSMSGRNILTLAEVRDQKQNQMARVNAVAALERMEDQTHAAGNRASTPGLVVVVVNAPSSGAVMADQRTEPESVTISTRGVPFRGERDGE